MAIEIIDGFKVSSAVPVDNRIVASGSNARSAIAYKYEGLRVFDTYDSTPYVWLSNSWKKENQTALSAATVAPLGFVSNTSYRVGQILKVFDSANTLTNSNIFEKLTLNVNGGVTNRAIAINHIDAGGSNTPNTVSNTVQLDVKGVVKATSFEGIGANITDISPLNFNTSTNKIKINQIEPGTNGYFLGNQNDELAWLDLASGFSPTSLTATVDASSGTVKYLTFIDGSSTSSPTYRHFSSPNYLIGVIPLTGQIVVKNYTIAGSLPGAGVSSPPYSFIDDSDTGIYNSAAGSVGISSNGFKRVEIDTNGLKVNAGNAANPGISFIGANNYGIYQTGPRIGVVVAGNEMIRINSSSTQGNGNTAIYGEGGLLSLIGNTHAYMEFYKTGSATPNTTSVPMGSSRGAYIGYPSGSNSDFYVTNSVTNASLGLLNNGRVYITSRANTTYGIEIGNSGSGTVTNAYGVYMYGTFTSAQLQNSHSAVIARFDAKGGSTPYTSVYVTTQGLLIWGCPTGTGTQPSFSGSAAKPSIAFNGNADSGFYSNIANTIGISTGGVSRVVINHLAVEVSNLRTSGTFGTTMKSIYHGWFSCNYNTVNTLITNTNLTGSGMSSNGFSYSTGKAQPFGGNPNHPIGFIKINTPPFTDVNKVIVQVTPRYLGVSQYMIFTAQVNTITDINIYFHAVQGNLGWNANNFAFNISIFEIIQ
jgi:hypothetical protein